jgi:tellurite resistance protein
MEQTTILEGYSDLEKGAYLGAIASIASADREASPEEMEHLTDLCEAAGLSEPQKDIVMRAATELSGTELHRCLDVLKGSELRHSLVADVILFAKSDNNYGPEEQASVEKIAQYLGLDQKQFSLLNEFTDKATASHAQPEEKSSPSFLSSLGLDAPMRSAGINTNGLFKGLLGFAGPMILSGMLSRMLGGRRRGGGMFGGGGMMGGGGLGGMLGGGGGMLGGGLGSLIGMLSGGRGFGGTRRGGMFGGLFG